MYKTEQEEFWAGEFGDNYIDRNNGNSIVANNTFSFAKIFRNTSRIKSAIEFGANIGLNLRALKNLFPNIELNAIEINKKASDILKEHNINVYNTSILDYIEKKQYDLALIKGVLIHINPDSLQAVYEKLYNSSSKYICISEYYNPTPVTISYRGNENRLFKRDFAGEMLDKYKNLKLIDYGFEYHRDQNNPQGDLTWFLLEKTNV